MTMELLTFYVGQGNLAVLRGDAEAIIIDAHMPAANDRDAEFVKAALASATSGRYVTGLVLTGFDADHADVRTVAWVLRTYAPDWVLYPQYFKDTDEASRVFVAIDSYPAVKRIPVRIDLHQPDLPKSLSDDFSFTALSPHGEDMSCSNNSSLVLRIDPVTDGFSYLVTGDTEIPRWQSICRYFFDKLDVDVLAAPHHGSGNGIDAYTLDAIRPAFVLVSAGIDNPYGHPHAEAVALYVSRGAHVFSTNVHGSLLTRGQGGRISTAPVDLQRRGR